MPPCRSVFLMMVLVIVVMTVMMMAMMVVIVTMMLMVVMRATPEMIRRCCCGTQGSRPVKCLHGTDEGEPLHPQQSDADDNNERVA